jgi:BirA family transcriptional regulator, biotin operon repressor / biotin---[acetyl-CoA-carboxylase] ligase
MTTNSQDDGGVAERLRSLLDPLAAPWVRQVHAFERVGSTNDVLKDLARAGAPEGTVVLAGEQTAGRGRHGRGWESPPGNLFLSFLLRPQDRTVAPLVPLAAGVAVAEAVAAHGAAPRLKWPNDVLVPPRKLAGILAEASAEAAGLESVVVGVGLNVNADFGRASKEVRAEATSLAAETGRPHDVLELAAEILGRWALWYDALRTDRARVREAWREWSLAWWGCPVEVIAGGQRLQGIARDLDDGGGLILETADGSRITVVSGEARELRPR